MKIRFALATCALVAVAGCSEKSEETQEAPTSQAAAVDSAIESASAATIQNVAFTDATLEIGCGMCIYEMDGVDGCTTAAMVNGMPFLVTGVEFNAHASGLCGGAKQAVVSGEVKDGAFVATKIEVQEG